MWWPVADVVIRAPVEGDVDALLANLRPADRDEIEALLGPGQENRAVTTGLRNSVLSWTGLINGQVACIFGVVPLSMLAGQGGPWMLGTPLIDRHRRALIRHSRPYIARMQAVFPNLVNIVDARNVKSIAWLKRMGFAIHAAQPIGVAGLPFHFFTMGHSHV